MEDLARIQCKNADWARRQKGRVRILTQDQISRAANGDIDFTLPWYFGCKPINRAETDRWLVSRLRRHHDKAIELATAVLAVAKSLKEGRGYHIEAAGDGRAVTEVWIVETVKK